MKRVALLAIAAVALIALAIATVPHFVSADLIKKRIAENIAAMTGREVALSGTPVLTIYPSLAITVSDLTIANPTGMSGEPFLTSHSLTAHVRLLPLLFGDAQFDTIELTKPRIHLVENADGKVNWSLAAAAPAAKPPGVAPRHLKISAGTIVYDNVAAESHEELTGVDLDASWLDAAAPLTASGEATWHGEPVEFNGQLGNPLAAEAGGTSPLGLALTAKPIRVSFNGRIGPQLDGTISVSTPALRRAIEWLGPPMGSGSTLGAASLKAKIDWSGSEIALADAAIELDGNRASGAFAFDYGAARSRLEGTLTDGTLDLSPYVEMLRGGDAAIFSGTGFPLITAIDADVGVSTDSLLIGAMRLDRASGALVISSGKLVFTISQASLYGGTLTASSTLTKTGNAFSSRTEARLSQAGARAALGSLAGVQVLEGTADADVVLSSAGATWGELVQRLGGRASFAVSNGTLAGLDVANLSALADAPSGSLTAGVGALKFTELKGTVSLDAGILQTGDTVLTGSGFRIDLAGEGSLGTGFIEASATLGRNMADERANLVPIAVSGTWAQPLFELDRERAAPSGVVSPRG